MEGVLVVITVDCTITRIQNWLLNFSINKEIKNTHNSFDYCLYRYPGSQPYQWRIQNENLMEG